MRPINPSDWEELRPQLKELARRLGRGWLAPVYGSWRRRLQHRDGLRVHVERTPTSGRGYVLRVTWDCPRLDGTPPATAPAVRFKPGGSLEPLERAIEETRAVAARLSEAHRAASASFAEELRALLAKHGATLELVAHDGSDWHGVTGERMGYRIGSAFVALADGLEVSAENIEA